MRAIFAASVSALLSIAFLVGKSVAEPPQSVKARADSFERMVHPFLQKHCVACHGPSKKKGDLRFDGPLPDLVDAEASEKWLAAKRMIAQGEMPPEDRLRPTHQEISAVIDWIDGAAARAAVTIRGGPGRRALRRLTNHEYVNTLHDLLGLSFPHVVADLATKLPDDAAPNAFSNDSNLQVMQRLQLQRRLILAEDLLAVALPDAESVKPIHYSVDVRQLAADGLAKHQTVSAAERDRLGGMTIRGTIPSEIEGIGPAKIEVRGDRGNLNMVLRVDHIDPVRGLGLEPNPVLSGVSKNSIAVLIPFVPDRGVLRMKAKVTAPIECDDSTPVLRLSFGGTLGPGNTAYPAAQVTVRGDEKPRDYALEIPLTLAPGDWNSFRREKQLWVQIDNAAALLGPTKVPEKLDKKERDQYLKRNRLWIESFTLEIGTSATWPPRSEVALLPLQKDEDENSRALRSLTMFLSKAFRRPATEAEIATFLRLYLDQRKAGAAIPSAYRTTLAAALISPQVQYMVETKDELRSPLTDWELATRLSYLIWNTTPDAELLTRAADGSLSTERELRKQLDRLLADERAFDMTREFTRQWLELDVLPHLEPVVWGSQRWPDSTHDRDWFDKTIRHDLAAEPAYYMLDLLRGSGRATELIKSDHLVVNDRLGRYYGVADIRGTGWQRVKAPDNRRGGLLTQAGCIAAATHGQQRGEIKRGVYLARKFLGLNIPSPPGNVDIKPLDIQVKEDRNLSKLTSRELLERHRTVTACAVCHERSDPLGFVWDEFDHYGQPRRDAQGKSLTFDSSGGLPDRTRFINFAEFRALLADESDSDRFTDAFGRLLYSYVLGRGLDPADEVHLKSARAAATKSGGSCRDLLTAMVLSEPFRNK